MSGKDTHNCMRISFDTGTPSAVARDSRASGSSANVTGSPVRAAVKAGNGAGVPSGRTLAATRAGAPSEDFKTASMIVRSADILVRSGTKGSAMCVERVCTTPRTSARYRRSAEYANSALSVTHISDTWTSCNNGTPWRGRTCVVGPALRAADGRQETAPRRRMAGVATHTKSPLRASTGDLALRPQRLAQDR